MQRMIAVQERPPLPLTLGLAAQHILAIFGATVLVPFLFKVDASTSLCMNGIGTLIYLAVCKWQVPAYLGSSFAFISPVLAIMAMSPSVGGYAAAQGGFVVFGCFFVIVSLIVGRFGADWIEAVIPPAAMGAIVAVIGLELAPVAVQMSSLNSEAKNWHEPAVALITFVTAIFCSGGSFRRLSTFPILIAVIIGTFSAAMFDLVSWDRVQNAAWLAVPAFNQPRWDFAAILTMAPAFLVVLVEHIGHLVITGEVVRQDFLKKPGLHRSLLGDGISNILSGLVGATPNTTYAESIGVMAVTRVFSVWVLGAAACLAIVLSVCGKVAALIGTIPTPVMGGVCLLLFGVIATSGLRILIEKRVDFTQPKNLILASVVLIASLGGVKIAAGGMEIKGMAVGTIAALIINPFLNWLKR